MRSRSPARLPVSERVGAEIEVLYSLAGIYLATLDARVVDTLTLLRERAAEYGLVDVEVKALVDLAYPLAWSGSERSIEVIDRALRLSDAQRDPLVRARTRARCMVRRLMVRGWNAEDAEESRRAMAEIRRLGTKEDVAWHLIDSGFVEVTSSHYRQAQRDAVDSLTLLRAVHDESIPLGYIAARRLREYIVPWSLTFLGEWGAALREFDASIALAGRNADSFGSGVLLLLRCWLQLFAMDFAGARSVCASILAAREPPGGMFGRHLCLTLSGAAEAGLGNHHLARERLLAARGEMDRRRRRYSTGIRDSGSGGRSQISGCRRVIWPTRARRRSYSSQTPARPRSGPGRRWPGTCTRGSRSPPATCLARRTPSAAR